MSTSQTFSINPTDVTNVVNSTTVQTSGIGYASVITLNNTPHICYGKGNNIVCTPVKQQDRANLICEPCTKEKCKPYVDGQLYCHLESN